MPVPDKSFAVVIVAAGRGERAGSSVEGPKQFRAVGGVPVIRHTVATFAAHPAIGRIIVMHHRDDIDMMKDALEGQTERVMLVEGGKTRQESTLNGLRALAAITGSETSVMVHDGVRCFVTPALIGDVAECVSDSRGAIPALPVSDTLKRCEIDGVIHGTQDRQGLYAAQTPQGFPFKPLLEAHEKAAASGRHDFTDDASIAEAFGLAVRIVPGDTENMKITWARDIDIANRRLGGQTGLPDVRTGNGYDVHAFAKGDRVTLCGVEIAHTHRLSGHSDADVALHALTDALLATCGAGDIGDHFPPSDKKWKGAASRIFVEHAAKLVRERGGRIANADVTLIAEAPKIGPHRAAMVATMADMLGIAAERCSVKATTNEKLGFVGRNEGIAAIATATVVYPGRL